MYTDDYAGWMPPASSPREDRLSGGDHQQSRLINPKIANCSNLRKSNFYSWGTRGKTVTRFLQFLYSGGGINYPRACKTNQPSTTGFFGDSGSRALEYEIRHLFVAVDRTANIMLRHRSWRTW